MPAASDPARCPLCGRPNLCQRACTDPYKGPCWCFRQEIPRELLLRVPLHLQGQACVCKTCVTDFLKTTNPEDPSLVAGPGDFYFDQGRIVFTGSYLQRRGFCCGSGCRHCPYPKDLPSRATVPPQKP